jgi:hypothetical protein
MIYLDIDGVLVDFYGTAKKFGIELELNEFGKWRWGVDGYPSAEEFYKAAWPHPWLDELVEIVADADYCIGFITKDCKLEKKQWLNRADWHVTNLHEAPEGKAAFCKNPCDLLIDDNEQECKAWRDKGGIAYWFNLAEQDPFGKFLKWWRLE